MTNSDLFYTNNFNQFGASPDPFVLYDEAEGGWFYMYYTGGRTLTAVRSRNLADWESVGTVFIPSPDSWIKKCLWAPEVIKIDDTYYMYLTASPTEEKYFPEGTTIDGSNNTIKFNDYQDGVNIVVLTASSPKGPFVQWTGSRPNNNLYNHGSLTGTGDNVTLQTYPFFDFANSPAGWLDNTSTYAQKGTNIFSTIDANPFIDSNGDLYMYFVRSHDSTGLAEHTIWGVKMINPITPDWSTMVKLTYPKKLTPNGEASPDGYMDGKLNEGPFVTKRNNKYYMFYCGGDGYNTSLAVSDSPLGTFTKLDPKYNNPILRVSPEFGFYNCPEGWGVFGAGHGMIFTAGNDSYFASLTTRPTADGKSTQRIAMFDRLTWVYNEELGYDLPVINGPTRNTLQPAPSVASGYFDIANQATVSATNIRSGSTVEDLTSGVISIHKRDDDNTFFANGATDIVLEFDAPVTVKAIMVYNARLPIDAFKQIDEIIFENNQNLIGKIENVSYSSSNFIGDITKTNAGNTSFSGAAFWEQNPLTDGGLLPGSSVTVELDEEIVLTKITIRISQNLVEKGTKIGVSNITVLGK